MMALTLVQLAALEVTRLANLKRANTILTKARWMEAAFDNGKDLGEVAGASTLGNAITYAKEGKLPELVALARELVAAVDGGKAVDPATIEARGFAKGVAACKAALEGVKG